MGLWDAFRQGAYAAKVGQRLSRRLGIPSGSMPPHLKQAILDASIMYRSIGYSVDQAVDALIATVGDTFLTDHQHPEAGHNVELPSARGWKDRALTRLSEQLPFLSPMHEKVSPGLQALANLKNTLGISDSIAVKGMFCAFKLGLIEAKVRVYADMSLMNNDRGLESVLLIAGFAAIKDGQIGSEAEADAYSAYCLEVLNDRSLEWFRKCGMFWGATTGARAGEVWGEFEDRVIEAVAKERR